MATTTYERPWLTTYQTAALFAPKRYGIVEATTKCGKTVGAMIWLTEQAMRGRSGQNYWWVSPVLSQSVIVYRRLKRSLPRSTRLFLALDSGDFRLFIQPHRGQLPPPYTAGIDRY